MLKMPTVGQNARDQTFAKVVDSFVDRYLWQVIPGLLLLWCQQTWIMSWRQQWRQ